MPIATVSNDADVARTISFWLWEKRQPTNDPLRFAVAFEDIDELSDVQTHFRLDGSLAFAVRGYPLEIVGRQASLLPQRAAGETLVVTLSQVDLATARRLGSGDAELGVREALRQAGDVQSQVERMDALTRELGALVEQIKKNPARGGAE